MLRNAFALRPRYWLQKDQAPSPASPNGFQRQLQTQVNWSELTPGNVEQFGLATVLPIEGLRTATDDWPFLYLRKPMIPTLSWRGMVIMGGLGLLLIALLFPRQTNNRAANGLLDLQLFFLLCSMLPSSFPGILLPHV